MSIIYEALKKTQEKLKVYSELDSKERKKLNLYIAFIFLALLGCSYALTTLLYTPSSLSDSAIKDSTTAIPPAQKPLTKVTQIKASLEKTDKFALSGIVSIDNEKLALINDEMVKKGDYIEGACVINILDDKVYLDLGGKPIVLKIK